MLTKPPLKYLAPSPRSGTAWRQATPPDSSAQHTGSRALAVTSAPAVLFERRMPLEHMGYLASREDVDARVADLERETLSLEEALLGVNEDTLA